ncbi:splicing factor C9orf78 homolog [Panonychus citri]|uniref:splicing factor C9orf78 homolog n=1 Tax=Panonychus citri TaxID=50023 RepID=UPI0023080CA9|nr:splicing factor C9orf78 homolog [Panonychus citri]
MMEGPTIKFKSIKKKPLRTKIADEGEDDGVVDDTRESTDNKKDNGEGDDEWDKLEELKLSRSLKRRYNKGINAMDLLTISSQETQEAKVKAEHYAGLMTSLDLANIFSVETNRRDEDQDMLKYIEEQLAERKGLVKMDKNETKRELIDPDDLVFNELRENLLKDEQKKNEEMLSSQMLSGIPEVDLGIDEKIRNIEATEEAKIKLMERKLNHRSTSRDSTLVPTNVAANYVQHNRFNVDTSDHNNKRPKITNKPVTTLVKEPVVQIGDEPKQGYFRTNSGQNKSKLKFPGKEKATDDYHFEKFKKQFRK